MRRGQRGNQRKVQGEAPHSSRLTPHRATLLACVLLLALGRADAAERRVTPADGPLQAAVDAAAAGDTLVLAAGEYRGGIRIAKPLRLRGEAGATIDGEGRGDVIRVTAPDVTLAGLTIRNSGHDLTEMNSGVFLQKGADRARVEDCRIEAVAFGVWLDALKDVQVLRNRISGDPAVRSQDRGNGIHFFNTTGSLAEDNEVRDARDGIYIDTSNRNALRGNRLHALRYGIHYMYAHHNDVVGNRTWNTRTGYALMQSKFLKVLDNRSEHDENYGLLLNFIDSSEIAGNVIVDVERGKNPTGADAHGISGAEGKALFVYSSLFNDIHDNVFARSEIGIHLTAGAEDNRIHANAFVDNRNQVKYVSNRRQEWSYQGRGNYWSDYLGWDRDGDGIGDTPYEPNDGVDQLLWQYPAARVLFASPAIETLRWVQRTFPVLRPPGITDSAPLMRAPPSSCEALGARCK